jgi:hypothetical protein
MIWQKVDIVVHKEKVEAIAPMILSVSRATDIPAFYARQFMESLCRGYLYWTNPFNNKKSLISLSGVQLIVFWSKNPMPLMPFLDRIDELGMGYYFNFTLNNYEKEGFEPNLPSLQKRIETFIELSERIGKEKVIWRFDPVIISSNQDVDAVIDKIESIASRLKTYTKKLVFSFVDTSYRKVQNKLKTNDIRLIDFDKATKRLFVEKLTERLAAYNLEIATCAEEIDFGSFGVKSNKCVDNELIKSVFNSNSKLVEFIKELETKNQIKDKGQREYCRCMVSKDVGRYNTCGFSCVYCYAMLKSSLNIDEDIFD